MNLHVVFDLGTVVVKERLAAYDRAQSVKVENLHVLLVDDDEAFVKRLAKAMEKRGFLPETASSIAEGKAAALDLDQANPALAA